MDSLDFSAITSSVTSFKNTTLEIKRNSTGVEWYPYDTLSAFTHLDSLLEGPQRQLFSKPNQRILDVGCQDGDLSFFLESLGHHVTAIDHPTYSHNAMRGVRAMAAALSSQVQILELDLDRQFTLPPVRYDIAIMLGVLYHLRNPFYVLEELARQAEYCLLSTRIARLYPNGEPMPPDTSVAYLLDDYELNADETNYFIFSEPALRVLLRRTHWDIAAFMRTGYSAGSDPVSPDRDERAFCLLKSCYDKLASIDLRDGWHEPEGAGWRWTRREFSIALRWSITRPPTVTLAFYVPDSVLDKADGALHVTVAAGESQLASETYTSPGQHSLVRTLPPIPGTAVLSFSLSACLEPDTHDSRQRGIVVTAITVT